MARKILQIIPAHNAIAVFRLDEKGERYPVICWALVEDSGPDDAEYGGRPLQLVVGMTCIDGLVALSEVDSGEAQGEFITYEVG